MGPLDRTLERHDDQRHHAEPATVARDVPAGEAVELSPAERPDDESGAAPAGASQARRLGARMVRRPVGWWRREWTTERTWRYVVTALALGITTAIMMNVVHLNPINLGDDLVFDDTTPTGGDFGAHVWAPAYLRDHLLADFRFNGWSMDWYAGMPTYRFYMVLPAFAILLADVVLPYGVAMKLVSVLGLITLPAACWAFGRLARFRHPIPELFAFAGVAFALDESFSIYGGNLKSTMAGEFSFSIALSLAMLGLGFLAAGLRTGKYRVWTSVLIAAAGVSHGIVLIFVAGAAVVFCVVWFDRERMRYILTVGLTAVLLMMWWVGPFLFDHDYMTDMKYGALTDWWTMFFPLTAPLDVAITTFAIIGFAFSVVRRNLNGAALGVTGLLLAAGVYLAKDSLPVIGLLWNPRLLPFLYLVRYLLMMIGIVEVFGLVVNVVRDRRALAIGGYRRAAGAFAAGAIPVMVVLGFTFQVLPGGSNEVQDDESTRYAWGPFVATPTNADAQGDGWARYNFQGYEGRGDAYAEYYRVVQTMADLGADPDNGCGRALWENSPDNGQYGTTMALMLLPHWTDGCIGSMEGLYFEASGTTPYHFIATAAMSKQSSNPVRELRYVNNDAAVGVSHLQDLGVRYAMVRSPEAKAEAAAQPDLTLVAISDPWEIYRVADSDLVVPLDTQPVVAVMAPGDGRERRLEVGTSWFQHRDDWTAIPAEDGPDSWQRVDAVPDPDRRLEAGDAGGPAVDVVVPGQPIEPVALPPVEVSNVEIGDDSIRFEVDEPGAPVLVRVSYFPNWVASGADGPWRAGANMMVVVPTDEVVELVYGRNAIDYVTMLLTLIGVGLCVLWRRQGDLEFSSEFPSGLIPGRPTATRDTGAPPDDAIWSEVGRADAVDRPAAPLDGVDRNDDTPPLGERLGARPFDRDAEPATEVSAGGDEPDAGDDVAGDDVSAADAGAGDPDARPGGYTSKPPDR